MQARRLARQPCFLASLSIPLPAPLKRHFQIRLSFLHRSALHLPSFRPLRMAQPLQLTKRKNVRIVPRPDNLLLRKSIRSHPGIGRLQSTSTLQPPKAWQRKLGASCCRLATAALLHSSSVHRVTSTQKTEDHPAPSPSHAGTLDRSNTCLRSHNSRMGRPPPPVRTTSPCPPAFDTCKRAQRNRSHIQSRIDLDYK